MGRIWGTTTSAPASRASAAMAGPSAASAGGAVTITRFTPPWRSAVTTWLMTVSVSSFKSSLGRPIRALRPAAGITAAIMGLSRLPATGRVPAVALARNSLSERGDTLSGPSSPGDQLGHDTDRDLGHRLRADLQADRRGHTLQIRLGNSGFAEALVNEPDLAATADQTDVSGRASAPGDRGLPGRGHVLGSRSGRRFEG